MHWVLTLFHKYSPIANSCGMRKGATLASGVHHHKGVKANAQPGPSIIQPDRGRRTAASCL